MKLPIFTSIALSSIFVSCGVEYKYVNIPQKCDTEIPQPIKPTKNIVEDVRNITQRAELLECKLRYCKGENTSKCVGVK